MDVSEFEGYLKALVRDHKPGLLSVFGQYGIADDPTPETLVLGYYKHGDAFADAIERATSPYEKSVGTVLKDIFKVGVAALTGISAAKNIAENKPSDQPGPDKPKPDKILGMPKVVFYSGAVMASLLIIYIILTKRQ